MRSDPHRRGKNTRGVACFFFTSLVLCFSFFLSFFPSLSLCVCVFMRCVKFLLRETNRLGEDSRCRGGIVNTRGGCSRARSRTARPSQGALAVSCKYFKQSKWPFSAAYQHAVSYIDHTYAQQDIRVCGDDHLQPPKRQYSNPKALCFFA